MLRTHTRLARAREPRTRPTRRPRCAGGQTFSKPLLPPPVEPAARRALSTSVDKVRRLQAGVLQHTEVSARAGANATAQQQAAAAGKFRELLNVRPPFPPLAWPRSYFVSEVITHFMSTCSLLSC